MIYPDEIIKSKRKTISLSIEKNGAIIVRAPSRMSDEQIKKFVFARQNWLISKLSEIKDNKNKYADIIQQKGYLLYGKRYNACVADVKRVETNENVILIPTKIDPTKRYDEIIKYFKRQAKTTLTNRLNYIKSIMKIEPKKVKLTNSKGKWGSCNSHQTIALNWRIIMLPPRCIDYIIIHELCHIIEMNHSSRFWNLVNTFLPRYNEYREELKEYSFLLELYR